MKRLQLFLVLCLNLCWLPVANAVTAQASVSSAIVGVNQAIQLVISIDKRVPTDEIEFDALKSDFVVGRPSTSSKYQNINGKSSIKTEWRLAIAPKRAGKLTIPVFDIDGYKTKPITLDVRQDLQSAQSASQKSDIIMKARLDRDTLYQGQTTKLYLTMYLGVELQNARIQPPQGDGVEIKQLGTDKQYRTQISGRNYMGVDVVYQVTPTQSGTLNIQGAILNGEKVTGRSSFFNQSSLSIPVESKANNLQLDVKPKPAQASGVWLPTEKLSITQSWQPDLSGINGSELKVGSPIERNIEVRAVGVDVLKMPKIQFTYPDSVKVYDEKPEFSVEGNETVMHLKQVIIPRSVGEVKLAGLDIEWFNSKTAKSQVSHIDGLTFNAIADPEQEQATPLAPIPAQKPQVQPQDKIVCTAPTAPEIVERTPVLWIIATISFALLWVGTLFYYLLRSKRAEVKPTVLATSSDIDIKYCKRLVAEQDDLALAQYIRNLDSTSYPSDIMAQVEAEIREIQASRYSQNRKEWSGDKLLSLLKRLKQGAQKSTDNQLARL